MIPFRLNKCASRTNAPEPSSNTTVSWDWILVRRSIYEEYLLTHEIDMTADDLISLTPKFWDFNRSCECSLQPPSCDYDRTKTHHTVRDAFF